jgi:hypothetical protein
MIIRNFGTVASGDARVTSAIVSWEDRVYPDQELHFEIHDDELDARQGTDEAIADAFLSACFPLAAVHGEARVRIEGQPCPMLIEGLYTAHAWWTSWGGMPTRAPKIETPVRGRGRNSGGPRRAVGFLSGGVDSLHMLMRNRRLYRQDDLAYISDALFIHGFDIGKRLRDPENERFRTALLGLQHVAGEIGLRIIPCRTNLRHLPSMPDFWEHRHSGAALAAVGHAAIAGAAVLFLGSSYPVADPVPWGSHPAVDGLFSSQRVTLVHDGSRFSRLQKVCDLASWPTALDALRVCPGGLGTRANCGECEKCLRTRLELLAAGVEETEAFGPSLTPSELWNAAIPGPIGDRAIFYEDLIGPLRARGLDAICRVLEEKIREYRAQAREDAKFAGRPNAPHYN